MKEYDAGDILTARGGGMAQAMINFRMDEGLKKNMEETCKAMGLTMTAVFTAFDSLYLIISEK